MDSAIAPKCDEVRIDVLSMCWSKFEALIQSVWDAASVKNDVRLALGLTQEKPDSGSSQPKRQSYKHPPVVAIEARLV